MDSNEILVPPFPRDTTTLSRLLTCLSELRAWLLEHRYWANEAYMALGGDGDIVPAPEYIPQIPDVTRYQAIAVQDIWQTQVLLRKLREDWDQMVRTYEEAWTVKPAVVWRLRLLRLGYAILGNAFVDPETREARQETFTRQVQKVQAGILKKLGVPQEMRRHGLVGMDEDSFGLGLQQGLKHDDVDFDALFHGEDVGRNDEPENSDDEDENLSTDVP